MMDQYNFVQIRFEVFLLSKAGSNTDKNPEEVTFDHLKRGSNILMTCLATYRVITALQNEHYKLDVLNQLIRVYWQKNIDLLNNHLHQEVKKVQVGDLFVTYIAN